VTVSKTAPQKLKRDGVNAMQTYLTSLMYLRQEAQRDGLEPVAEILWNALAAIEQWLDTGKAPVKSSDILDSPLCHSLEFLMKWTALPPATQRQVAKDIDRYEAVAGVGESVSRPRRLANRKTVN
jgi:hypothetical protein